MKTPLIIITRDRPTYLADCIESLLPYVDDLDVHIVDHGSTLPMMLTVLEAWTAFDLPVHYRGDEQPQALWDWPGLAEIAVRRGHTWSPILTWCSTRHAPATGLSR